jgi:hypothetical protein
LLELIQLSEGLLSEEITLSRQENCPFRGLLVDKYLYGTNQCLIVFPTSVRGLLKDFIIARHVLTLLFRGLAAKNGDLRVLSYDQARAITGMKQVYLDLLKDEGTRSMPLERKRAALFRLYMTFRDLLSEVPEEVLAEIVISKKIPAMRNAQVYFLIKESMRDMYGLDAEKAEFPHRHVVMRNAVYYARDVLLAYMLSEFKLNPVINIPELQEFKNLDMRGLIDHRWSRSSWAHTKQVGDALSSVLKLTLTPDFDGIQNEQYFRECSACGREIVNRWMIMMGTQDWFLWESPAHLKEASMHRSEIEASALKEIFSE